MCCSTLSLVYKLSLVSSGQIGYALAPLIARGLMCGFERPVFLHMHDSEAAQQNLHAVQMELMDAASSLLRGDFPAVMLPFLACWPQ